VYAGSAERGGHPVGERAQMGFGFVKAKDWRGAWRVEGKSTTGAEHRTL